MKIFPVLLGLVASAMFLGASANIATALTEEATVTVSAEPSVETVRSLLARLANGRAARRSDAATVTYVLDSTERYALRKNCGFRANGTELSSQGHLHEAHLVGQTLPSIGTAKTRASARAKLAYYNGVCYLKTPARDNYVRNAYAGAVRRTALALSKMIGETVELRDPSGKTIGVYRWSNKW